MCTLCSRGLQKSKSSNYLLGYYNSELSLKLPSKVQFPSVEKGGYPSPAKISRSSIVTEEKKNHHHHEADKKEEMCYIYAGVTQPFFLEVEILKEEFVVVFIEINLKNKHYVKKSINRSRRCS